MTEKCSNPPAFKYTWPGEDEKFLCAFCALRVRRIAGGMGLHVQVIPITVDDLLKHDDVSCSQMVEEQER